MLRLKQLLLLLIVTFTLRVNPELRADNLNPAYSLETLPNSYSFSGQELVLEYLAASSSLLAGRAYVYKSDFATPTTTEPKPDRIFFYDRVLKQLSLGPEFFTDLKIHTMHITPGAKVILLTSVASQESGIPEYRILMSNSSGGWSEVPTPLPEYYSTAILGDADRGIYLIQTYYTADGSRRAKNFYFSGAEQFDLLTNIPENYGIYSILPSGILLASNLTDSQSFIISDAKSDSTLRPLTVPQNTQSILNQSTVTLWNAKKNFISTYDLESGISGKKIYNTSNGSQSVGSQGFFTQRDLGQSWGELTFFNSSKQITPHCSQPARSKDKVSLAPLLSAGDSVICLDRTSSGEHYTKQKIFLVTPDFESESKNYCSRLLIKALGSCRKYFNISFGNLYASSSDQLPDTCSFSVKLINDSESKVIEGILNYFTISKKYKYSKSVKRKLQKKPAIIKVDMRSLRSLVIKAQPTARSGYINSRASISVY